MFPDGSATSPLLFALSCFSVREVIRCPQAFIENGTPVRQSYSLARNRRIRFKELFGNAKKTETKTLTEVLEGHCALATLAVITQFSSSCTLTVGSASCGFRLCLNGGFVEGEE